MSIPEAHELVNSLAGMVQKTVGMDQRGPYRRGVIAAVFANGEPQIHVDGEQDPRDIVYTRLSPAFEVGDRVFLFQVFGSWMYWVDYTTSYDAGE